MRSTAIEKEDRKEAVSVCHKVMFSHKCKNVDAARVKGWRVCATVSRQSWCCNAENSSNLHAQTLTYTCVTVRDHAVVDMISHISVSLAEWYVS